MNSLYLVVIVLSYTKYAHNDSLKSSKMMDREDVLAKLTTKLVTKINGEPRLGDIKLLEQKLPEKAAKVWNYWRCDR